MFCGNIFSGVEENQSAINSHQKLSNLVSVIQKSLTHVFVCINTMQNYKYPKSTFLTLVCSFNAQDSRNRHTISQNVHISSYYACFVTVCQRLKPSHMQEMSMLRVVILKTNMLCIIYPSVHPSLGPFYLASFQFHINQTYSKNEVGVIDHGFTDGQRMKQIPLSEVHTLGLTPFGAISVLLMT